MLAKATGQAKSPFADKKTPLPGSPSCSIAAGPPNCRPSRIDDDYNSKSRKLKR